MIQVQNARLSYQPHDIGTRGVDFNERTATKHYYS